uniref:RUN domain-containing protein n=1 Tax=Mesocestoides corti TaxID=53468 RepID=A0A5K3F742_MESCO
MAFNISQITLAMLTTAPDRVTVVCVVWRRIRAQTCWTTWQQPIPCLSAIQWHAEKISSQPQKDMDEMLYIMSGVASVADSDGRRLTRGSGF